MNFSRRFHEVRARRKARSRAKIFGSRKRPRLAVFRSNTAVYAQLIDDERGQTLVSASSREVRSADKAAARTAKSEEARRVGELLARKALVAGVTAAVFDRRHYRYHGRVRALAEGARSGGLKV